MQQLRDNAGAQTVESALRFLAIRLRSRPETSEIAGAIDDLRARLRQSDDAWQQAREERVAASAEVAYRDGLLDTAMGNLVREVLMVTGGRYDDPRYVRLFPTTPSNVMRQLASETQTRYVKSAIAILRETAELEPLRGHAASLETALSALGEALTKRDGLYVPEAQAQAERRVVLDAARRLYERTYHELKLRLPGQDTLIESFFPRRASVASATPSPATANEPEAAEPDVE